MMILILFDPMKKLREIRHDRLMNSTPLLHDYQHVGLDYYELKRIHSKYRMCRLLGHLWEIEALIPSPTETHLNTYHLSCAACFPHIHSRRTHKTYNLFAISEKEQD